MKKASPARAAAWSLLRAVHEPRDSREKDAPLPSLLDRRCAELHLDSRDAALAAALVYGTLRREGRLRAVLTPFLRKPESLPRPFMLLLLMGTYERFFLDIPARATLHEIAGMANAAFGPGLGGMANAVMRAVDREAPALLAQDRAFIESAFAGNKPSAADIARAGSLPLWLADLWANDYGPAVAWAVALSSAEPPVPAYRINALAPDAEAARAKLRELGLTVQGNAAWGLVSSAARNAEEKPPPRP